MYKRWIKKDFSIRWVWHRSRLRDGPEGYYEIVWNKTGRVLRTGFTNKKWAEQFLADFLRKAHQIRKAAAEKGIETN